VSRVQTVGLVLVSAVILIGSLSSSAEAGSRTPRVFRGQFQVPAHKVHRTKGVSGLQVSLDLPANAYPNNALVRAMVAVRNVSHHMVSLYHWACRDNPRLEVTDFAGAQLFPPALPSLANAPCGPLLRPHQLLPGQVSRRYEYIILRDIHVRAVVDILTPSLKRVHGPVITVALHAAPSPTIVTHETSIVSVDIVPPAGAAGKYLYQQAWGCTGSDGTQMVQYSPTQIWTKHKGRHLTRTWPDSCSAQRWWRLVAGWLNYPVTDLAYGTEPPLN